MTVFKGNAFGFTYEIEKSTRAEFDTWLEAKLKRYIMTSPDLVVLKKVLGLDALEARIAVLEAK